MKSFPNFANFPASAPAVTFFFSIIPLALGRIPLCEFYPFGPSHSQLKVPTADDNYVEHVLSPNQPIYFFEKAYDKVFINNNGGISFGSGVPQYTPTCDPQSTPMIIPFWADVDTRDGGEVWYGESTDPSVLSKATRETVSAFPGLQHVLRIERLFIITWHEVAFFGSKTCGVDSNSMRNSFQAVIATQGRMSFIIFNYDEVNWVTGTASGGNCQGQGGTQAKSGFDTGDRVHFFSLPGSCTETIAEVTNTSNIDVNGKWIFRVDEEEVVDPQEVQNHHPEAFHHHPEVMEEVDVAAPIPEGECNPEDCTLKGYCFQYFQCDPETRTLRTFQCSHGLYWNPRNRSQSGTSEGQGHCHGSCDLWENLEVDLQLEYESDRSCFPKCTYSQIAECENRYMFHPQGVDARYSEILRCPVDTRAGLQLQQTPLVWVQERKTCDFCYNAFRHPDANGTVHPCCDKYDGHLEENFFRGEVNMASSTDGGGVGDEYGNLESTTIWSGMMMDNGGQGQGQVPVLTTPAGDYNDLVGIFTSSTEHDDADADAGTSHFEDGGGDTPEAEDPHQGEGEFNGNQRDPY